MLIVLALVLLTSGESNALDRITWLGWIALIGGVVLLFLAWRGRESEVESRQDRANSQQPRTKS